MTPFCVDAPVRADLAGGTLDIWPLSAMVPGAATFNCTLSGGVRLTFVPKPGDTRLTNRATGITEPMPTNHPDLHILAEPIRRMAPELATGWDIILETDIPRGSGLGTSSVILTAMLSGIHHIRNETVDRHRLVQTAADIEARIITVPTGIQDYIAPLFGGISEITFPPGRFQVNSHPVPEALTEQALLIFTGIHHFSGAPNWEVLKLMVEQTEYRSVLNDLVAVTQAVRNALVAADMDALGSAMREDYEIRKQLPVKLVPHCPDLFRLLENNPDLSGFRMCGAAGGGCILALTRPGRKDTVARDIHTAGYRILDLVPADRRLTIDTP